MMKAPQEVAHIMVSEKALQEFKNIWREEFGEDISDEKALEEAVSLLTLFDTVYRPIPKTWNDEYERKHKNHGTA